MTARLHKFQFHLINPKGQLNLFFFDILIKKHRFMKILSPRKDKIQMDLLFFQRESNEVIVL